jgi:hypothetical protein
MINIISGIIGIILGIIGFLGLFLTVMLYIFGDSHEESQNMWRWLYISIICLGIIFLGLTL